MNQIGENEPTLSKIDDYRGNESKQKRVLVWAIIAFLIFVGLIFTMFDFGTARDELVKTIPTEQN